jgi:hypothetical protein
MYMGVPAAIENHGFDALWPPRGCACASFLKRSVDQRIRRVHRVDQLDRDLPVEKDILGEMHDAHRPGAELSNEAVTAVDHELAGPPKP